MVTSVMADNRPIRFVTDERLDFNHPTPLRKSYLIASSYRSGSQYLCWQLWETGVLGAPCEYLNPSYEIRTLKQRFNVISHADYIAKLLARRTSKNGVFGTKEHFHHFQAFIKEYPELLEVLSPVTYIYINRRDRVAQAVSMAKALQTNWWSSRMEEGERPPLNYDRELIAKCMREVELQDAGWLRWFEARKITPHPLTYEDLTSDTAGVVRSVVELLGVQDDEPERVRVPPARKQSDDTNREWIERYERETRAGGGTALEDEHFCARHPRFYDGLGDAAGSASGFIGEIRLRRRYDAIVAHNRDLLRGARVLDLQSGQGFWTLAALDAGASRVVGVEPSRRQVATAEQNLAYYQAQPGSFGFVVSDVHQALEQFAPGSFDVVLCKGFFEQSQFSEFFRQLYRLKIKHVVLDTRIVPGDEPVAHFTTGGTSTITATPTHQLVTYLCQGAFAWRLVDWQAMSLPEWTGVQDYAADRQRTYVLDRLK